MLNTPVRLLLHRQDGSARRVVDMHPRDVAGATPDEREQPLPHELDLIVVGARPVEPAVAQDRAACLDDHVLEVVDRLRPLHHLQRVLLGLDPSALADSVHAGVALRDDVGDTGRLGRGQQVVDPLAAEPVGGGEEAVGLPQVGLAGVRHGKARHLVHDRVRPGRGHRLAHRRRIQPVHHDALGAQLLQQPQLARARRRRGHLVATGHQLRHQTTPDNPGPACHEHSHHVTLLIRYWLSSPRRDSPAACDIGDGPRTSAASEHHRTEREAHSSATTVVPQVKFAPA